MADSASILYTARMDNSILKIFTTLCSLLLILGLAISTFLFTREIKHTQAIAYDEFIRISSYLQEQAFSKVDDEAFRQILREAFLKTNYLLAISIRDSTGPLFILEKKIEEGNFFGLNSASVRPLFINNNEYTAVLPNIAPQGLYIVAKGLRIDIDAFARIVKQFLLVFSIGILLVLILLLFSSIYSTKNRPNIIVEPSKNLEIDIATKIPELHISSNPNGLYTPDSNIGWTHYIMERLNSELERSASFEQDLVLILMDSDAEDKTDTRNNLANLAVSFFSFRDLIFEYGGAGLAIILPNIDLEHGIRMTEEFIQKLAKSNFDSPSQLYFGISSRIGRLLEGQRLLTEAETALEKAEKEKTNRIIGFKVNPDRYREYLTKTS